MKENKKKLDKNVEVELKDSQFENVSGGFGSAVEVETEVEVGDVKIETGNISLINTSDIRANINMNTSGDHNTVQNNGGITVSGK